LLLEAPGTYHHSLMVGNLAEQAAEAVGADALVTRVAAYYHDVGKLYDPMIFIENQAGGENIHDHLPPEESAAMIVGHVAHGIDIAYQYKLPKALIPYIPQHHGTALMGFFYGKARQIASDDSGAPAGSVAAREAADKVDQRRFRHAGPKPQTREAAILMLADSVEASVRSLSSHDEAAIRAMVTSMISDRLLDGQFDESDLTLRDLDRIRESFIEQLLAMYHRRIAYPTNKIVELESRRPVERKGA
jgi:putative nucleotidyltransferase with HDIG domain